MQQWTCVTWLTASKSNTRSSESGTKASTHNQGYKDTDCPAATAFTCSAAQ
jgi:hypothetical protein